METITIELNESKCNAKATMTCDKKMGEDFLDWLENECNGEEPTYELFEEFLELETNFRSSLIQALNKEVSA